MVKVATPATKVAQFLDVGHRTVHRIFLREDPSAVREGLVFDARALARVEAELHIHRAGVAVARLGHGSPSDEYSRAPVPLLHWYRMSAREPGFGGYPSYAQWYGALAEGLRTDRVPIMGKGLDLELLEICRQWASLYLDLRGFFHPREECWLSTSDVALPAVRTDDVPKGLPFDRALLERLWTWIGKASTFCGLGPYAKPSDKLSFTEQLHYGINIVALIQFPLNETVRDHPEVAPHSSPEEPSVQFVRTQEFKNRVAEVLGWATQGKAVVIHSGPEPRALVERDAEVHGLPCIDEKAINEKPQLFIRRAAAGEQFFLDEARQVVMRPPGEGWSDKTREHHWRDAYASDSSARERRRQTYWKDPDASRQRLKDEYWRDPEASRQRQQEARAVDPERARQSVSRSRENARGKKRQQRASAFASDVLSTLGVQLKPLDGIGDLSPREREVVKLFLAGCSHAEVAAKLELSSGAVSTLRARAQKKLGLADLMTLRVTTK